MAISRECRILSNVAAYFPAAHRYLLPACCYIHAGSISLGRSLPYLAVVLDLLPILFIHNFLLAPLLIKKMRVAYFCSVLALLAIFSVVSNYLHGPDPHRNRPPLWLIERENRLAQKDHLQPPFPICNFDDHHLGPLGPESVVNLLLLIGILGLNLGVKFYFKSEQDRNHLQQLEKERMFLQLQYLKFQINPHFFMNTLNNIQVLIDMDAEKAKECLRELSVMMRFVLYNGDKDRVSLHKDILFLRNYVKLMRLRYNDRLTVTIDIPDNLPDFSIPPLISLPS